MLICCIDSLFHINWKNRLFLKTFSGTFIANWSATIYCICTPSSITSWHHSIIWQDILFNNNLSYPHHHHWSYYYYLISYCCYCWWSTAYSWWDDDYAVDYKNYLLSTVYNYLLDSINDADYESIYCCRDE